MGRGQTRERRPGGGGRDKRWPIIRVPCLFGSSLHIWQLCRTRLARSQRRPGGYLGARRMRRYVADTLKRMRGRREGGGVWGTVEAENLKVGEHGGRASEAGAGDLIWVMCVRMDGPSVFGESVPLPALVRRYIMPRPSSRIPPWFVHPTPHVPPPRV